MKKNWIVCSLLALLVLMSACDAKNPSDPMSTTKGTTESTAANTTDNTTMLVVSPTLPVYDPGSIKLIPEEAIREDENWPFFPKYRLVYYTIDGVYRDLYDDDRAEEWGKVMKKKHIINGVYAEADEMDYVTLVKYFQIERVDFEKAIEKQMQNLIELLGMNETNRNGEGFELPNADIIYTFNNEKINDYYSRDLKKAKEADEWLQEWLRTNQPYESYSAFLAR